MPAEQQEVERAPEVASQLDHRIVFRARQGPEQLAQPRAVELWIERNQRRRSFDLGRSDERAQDHPPDALAVILDGRDSVVLAGRARVFGHAVFAERDVFHLAGHLCQRRAASLHRVQLRVQRESDPRSLPAISLPR